MAAAVMRDEGFNLGGGEMVVVLKKLRSEFKRWSWLKRRGRVETARDRQRCDVWPTGLKDKESQMRARCFLGRPRSRPKKQAHLLVERRFPGNVSLVSRGDIGRSIEGSLEGECAALLSLPFSQRNTAVGRA